MIDRRKVYYCILPGEKKYSGLAIDVHTYERTEENYRALRFIDPPEHPHEQRGEVIRETEDGFVFRCDQYQPGEWVFKELTIEAFRRWVYKHVGEGEVIASVIHTTDDLHEWYRKKFHFPTEDK